uniref:Uncharacterized protein n=1 Tax=Pavo cristatus TaxID=9049 RepID=A0A8C9FQU9_PAVCR
MKEAWFCYNNPYFVFQESRGASSLLKDSIPIADFSLPGPFEGHGLLRRGYIFFVAHKCFSLNYIIPSRNFMHTVCSKCSFVQLSHHLWAVSERSVDYRFNVLLRPLSTGFKMRHLYSLFCLTVAYYVDTAGM